jgi:nucleoside-diphosphate-sugar epimerase
MSRSILITGGTGFVGSRLTRKLEAYGDHVTNIPRSAPGTSAQVAAAVTQAFDEAQPDLVCSLAISRAHATLEQVGDAADAAVRLPAMLIHECARREIPLIVTASYMLQRGGTAPTLFSALRGGVEQMLDWAALHANLRCVTLSLTSVHGPGDARAKLIGELLRAARSGEAIEMAPPERLLDLVHVDDVTDAYLRAAELLADPAFATNQHFDVSSGHATPLAQIVAQIEQQTGRPIDARWNTRPMRPSDLVDPPAHPSWLPGWSPCSHSANEHPLRHRDAQIVQHTIDVQGE